MKENENFSIIAKELEKQNAYRMYEIESETDKEKAYVELKKELSKIEKKYDEKNQKDNETELQNEEELTDYKNQLYRNGAYYTKDYEVRSAMNMIMTEMFDGYSAGERHERLVKQAERIIFVVRYRKLTKLNGSRILYSTAQNCTPPYDQKETAKIWKNLMKNEM